METLRFVMVSTHFPPHHLGGDAVSVEYLSKELIKEGHDVHVFYNPAVYKLLRGQETPLSGGKDEPRLVRHPYASRTGRLDPFLALSVGYWGRTKSDLERLVGDIKPDVVHWHNPRGFIGKAFPFPSAVSLYTLHDYTPVCPRSNLLKPHMIVCQDPRWCTVCCLRWKKPPQLWRTGSKRVLRFSDSLKLLSPSEFVAKRMRQEGVSIHRVLRGFVPDLGADFRRDDTSNDAIVYLGLMEPHKGVQVLFDAFVNSSDSHGFKLHMIGEGSLRQELLNSVRRLGLAGRISLPGFLGRDETENVRRNAVAQVVPSIWYENAPAVALEAYSLGIPVVASEIGGLPEIVRPEDGSVTFPPGDSRELAKILVLLWETRDQLNDRRRMARNAYDSRFRPKIHLKEYLKIIREQL